MIEALAQVVCTAIQVEASADGPSTVFQVRFPSGESTPINALGVRLNAIGYSAAQDLVYGVDQRGGLVALDRSGRVVGKPTHPSPLLSSAKAGAVVGERLVVRAGSWLHSVNIDPDSRDYGEVVHKALLWPWEGVTVDDFDFNAADGLLYGVATHPHGHGVVVSIDPDSGRTKVVPGIGALPGGSGYGAATLAPDGSLYATNNRHGGRSSLWRIALDGSGLVTEISSRQALNTIDSTSCLPVPPPTTTTPTPTTTPPTTTTTPPTTIPTTTTVPPTTPPTTTTTRTPPPGIAPLVPPPFTLPPYTPPSPSPHTLSPAPPVPPPPRGALDIPDRRADEVALSDNDVRDQRRWGLVAMLLILGAGALARQAASRRR